MTAITKTRSTTATLLLIGASSLALAAPASANDLIFSSSGVEIRAGQRISQTGGVTQIALTRGGTVSINDAAEYTVNEDSSIDLHKGSVTVSGGDAVEVLVRMPGGLRARLARRSSASFNVTANGDASGHTLTGEVSVARNDNDWRAFRAGMLWDARFSRSPRRTAGNAAISQPDANRPAEDFIAIGGDAGPVNAALNGIPVTLGDGLAGAGASADIVEAGRAVELAAQNPSIENFPTRDLAALVAATVRVEGLYGGRPFNGAQADIIRAYLQYLASGASGADFLTAYSAFLVQYLDLIRDGGVPSTFASGVANSATIEAYLAFIARTGAIANLSSDDRELAEAYLAFIANGGSADEFAASLNLPDFAAFAGALNAYADFLGDGGLPSDYDAADIAELQAFYSALVQAGQATDRLGSDFDLLAAYFSFLGTGGAVDGFAGLPIYADYAAALANYAQFLANGNLPSDYAQLDIAVLEAYIAALAALPGGITGFNAITGDQSALLTAYFEFLSNGGTIDGFAGLPIYADYAAALADYAAFLAAGNLPSDYAQINIDILEAYLAALSALPGGLAGFDAITGEQLALINAYFTFLAGGGDIDGFAALPIYLDYIAALNAYFAFLANGGLPSEYTALDLDIIEAYLAALAALDGGLGGFADLADFFEDYFDFIQGGGDPDDFAGLPGNTPGLQSAYMFASAFGERNGVANSSAQITPEGQITQVTTGVGTQGERVADFTASRYVAQEFGRFGNAVAWTRYDDTQSDPAFSNPGAHLLVGTPATNIPTSGTVNYNLVGGTAPTNSFAPAGDAGYFTGDLAVAFGSQARVGFNFDVAFGDNAWRTQTPGGAAGAASGGATLDPNGSFFTLASRQGLNGTPCPGVCQTNVTGGLFGTGGSFVGLRYFFNDPGTTPIYANGVAIFGTQGTALDGLGIDPNSGGGTPDPITGNYAGGFVGGLADTRVITVVGADFDSQDFFFTETNTRTSDAEIAANGVVNRFSGPTETGRGTADSYDVYGDSDILIGRWSDGVYRQIDFDFALSANQGVHYIFGRPLSPTFDLFAKSSIRYSLEAATLPTIVNGSLSPGVFSGNIAINIDSSAPSLGIDAQAVFQTAAGEWIMSLLTPGGLDNPDGFLRAEGNNAVSQLGYFNVSGRIGSDNMGVCPTEGCVAYINGQFASNSTSRLGLSYAVGPQFGDPRTVIGAAIFNEATGSSGGDTGSGTGFTGTRNGIVYYTYLDGSLASGFGGSADLVDGELTGFTSILGTVDIGSAEAVESGDVGTMAWARWTNGTVEARTIVGNIDSTLGANGGYHVMAGTPSASLPASGTINYELIGTTSVTDSLGSTPGTITGDLAISFGSISLVGFDLSMNIGGRGYSVSTNGGAANPAASQTNVVFSSGGPIFTAAFNNVIPGSVTATGGACQFGCQVSVSGALYGANASHVGVAMNVLDTPNGGRASGLAIFGQQGAATTGVPTPSAGPVSASADWSRWSASADPTSAGMETGSSGDAVSALSSTLADPDAANTAGVTAPNERAVAIERAQQMLGGAISWPSEPGPRR